MTGPAGVAALDPTQPLREAIVSALAGSTGDPTAPDEEIRRAMKADGTWQGGFRTDLGDGRGHPVVVDLERSEGGSDAGTSALELSVLSLAGCIMTIFALVARKRRLPIGAMSIELRAERPRGARTITAVEGELSVSTSAPRSEVETALSLTVATCPVGVLFEKAGIPLTIRAEVTPSSGTGADRAA